VFELGVSPPPIEGRVPLGVSIGLSVEERLLERRHP